MKFIASAKKIENALIYALNSRIGFFFGSFFLDGTTEKPPVGLCHGDHAWNFISFIKKMNELVRDILTTSSIA